MTAAFLLGSGGNIHEEGKRQAQKRENIHCMCVCVCVIQRVGNNNKTAVKTTEELPLFHLQCTYCAHVYRYLKHTCM